MSANSEALDQAAKRLDRAVALLEQRLARKLADAGAAAGGALDQDRAKLAEALDAQREARGQTQALAIDLQQTASVQLDDVVALQSAELNQRRVERLLAGEQDGVLAQIDGLIDLVRRNRLDNPDIQRRIGDLRTAVAKQRSFLNKQFHDLRMGVEKAKNRRHARAELEERINFCVLHGVDGADELVSGIFDGGEKQRLFVAEVPIDGPFADPDSVGNLLHVGLGVAFGGKDADGCVEDLQ